MFSSKYFNKTMRTIAMFVTIPLFMNCSTDTSETDRTVLKGAYQDAFVIGTALNMDHIYGNDEAGIELTKNQFNAITPENVMKWAEIYPTREEGYVWEPADKFVEFGEANDMYMTGHTLVWHSQMPSWAFYDEDENQLDREALLEVMREHIHTVVGRYKGRVQSWDVVNEALNEDGTLRETYWYNIIGKDYLVHAFKFAHEADPDANLYYNDYSLEIPSKRAGAVELVKYLQENDAPIHGIGTQGHFMLDWPELSEIRQTIEDFSALGIDVMVTELDVDVLPPAFDYMGADVNMSAELSEELNPYADGLPADVQEELTNRYRDIFDIYLDYTDAITRITFWGVTDGDSWKNGWPVSGRTNYPLVFDRDYAPKPAQEALIQLAKERL